MHLVIFVQWRKVVIFTNSLTASPPSEGWPVWSVCTFVVVRSLSHVWLFATPWTTARQASLSFTIFWSLLTLTSIESVMPSHHLILCHPLFPLPSIFSSIRVFFKKSSLCIRWPKYWSFSFSISPANQYSWLISFRIGWFDLLAVQGTLKSLLQKNSLKSSILQHSAFTMVQQFCWGHLHLLD